MGTSAAPSSPPTVKASNAPSVSSKPSSRPSKSPSVKPSVSNRPSIGSLAPSVTLKPTVSLKPSVHLLVCHLSPRYLHLAHQICLQIFLRLSHQIFLLHLNRNIIFFTMSFTKVNIGHRLRVVCAITLRCLSRK